MPDVTLRDVAAHAGVSVPTVSKVLNGKEDVSAETRRRVLDAVTDLGYFLRPRASGGSSRRSVLVLLDRVHTMYTAEVLDGIIDAAHQLDLDVDVQFALRHRRFDEDGVLLPRWCIGVVLFTRMSAAHRSIVEQVRPLPVVCIDPMSPLDSTASSVASANEVGGQIAAEYLLTLGHLRIGWLGGPRDAIPALERYQGYQNALRERGLMSVAGPAHWGDFTFEFGAIALDRVLSEDPTTTALIAANDELAVGAMNRAHELGLNVPNNLTIVGFDGTTVGTHSHPRLTTILQPLRRFGEEALRILTDPPAKANPQRIRLAVELHLGASSAPPPLLSAPRPERKPG